MVVVTGASGVRAGLRAYLPMWLTPRRLRYATVALCVAAFLGGAVTFGGSTAPAAPRHLAPATAR